MLIKDLDFRQLLEQVFLIKIDTVRDCFSELKGYETAEAALIFGSFEKNIGIFFVVISLLEEKDGTYNCIPQADLLDPVLLPPGKIAHLEAYDPGAYMASSQEMKPFHKPDMTDKAVSAMYRSELDDRRLKNHPDIVQVVYMDRGNEFRNVLVRVTDHYVKKFYGVEINKEDDSIAEGKPMNFEVREKLGGGWVCVNDENYPTDIDDYEVMSGRALDFALRRDYFENSVSGREFAVKMIKASELYLNEEDDEPVVIETAQGKAYEFYPDNGDDEFAFPYTIEDILEIAERDGVTCLIADSGRFDLIYSLDEFQ